MKKLQKIHISIYWLMLLLFILISGVMFFILNVNVESSINTLLIVSDNSKKLIINPNDFMFLNKQSYLVLKINDKYTKTNVINVEYDNSNYYIEISSNIQMVEGATISAQIIYETEKMYKVILNSF